MRAADLLAEGLRHHQAGRLPDAEACYRRVLAAEPEHADALHLLGVIAYQLKRHDVSVALIRQAIKQNGRNPFYFSHLGTALRDQGKLDEAIVAYRQAIGLKPDFAEAHSNLGNALRDQGKIAEAILAYRRAIGLKPDYAEAHSNLGNALRDEGELDEAIVAYRRAIGLKPDYAVAHSNLGNALRAQGKLDAAIASHSQAIGLKSDYAEAHYNLGSALQDRGRLEDARQAYLKALALDPSNIAFYVNFVDLWKFTEADPHLTAMEELEHDEHLSKGERTQLHFALSKAYADLDDHDRAFAHLLQGNALKRSQITYDEPAVCALFEAIGTALTPAAIKQNEGCGDPSPVPIFILGMPRSGTTLIEQILASHPLVHGAGELSTFAAVSSTLPSPDGSRIVYPHFIPALDAAAIRQIGQHYVAELGRLAPAAQHVTDKMPSNFFFVGLIHLALPNAPIIHVMRDPVDTCLSCFSKLFVAPQNHTYDLAELGRFYCRYVDLMAHWRRILPSGRILDVRYEDVVADLEGQAKRIVAHCGLAWDDRCLSFHKTERVVRTASARQVRQPIYTGAVGRWRVYERYLGPLLAELGIESESGRRRGRSSEQ